MDLMEVLLLYLNASDDTRNQIDLLLEENQSRSESLESLDCTLEET